MGSLKIPKSQRDGSANWLGGGFVRHTNSRANELKVVRIDCPRVIPSLASNYPPEVEEGGKIGKGKVGPREQ